MIKNCPRYCENFKYKKRSIKAAHQLDINFNFAFLTLKRPTNQIQVLKHDVRY